MKLCSWLFILITEINFAPNLTVFVQWTCLKIPNRLNWENIKIFESFFNSIYKKFPFVSENLVTKKFQEKKSFSSVSPKASSNSNSHLTSKVLETFSYSVIEIIIGLKMELVVKWGSWTLDYCIPCVKSSVRTPSRVEAWI